MSKVRTQEPEGFAEFWQEWLPVCRESDGRPKARAAYTQHILSGANPEDILLAARYHIRQRKHKGSLDWIQLASVWLNAERYEFEAEREREYQSKLAASQAQNIIPMNKPTPVLPENHFSRQWAKAKKEQSA